MRRICDGLTHSGQPCRAPAMPGDSRCINHSENPEVQELKRSATRRGGKMSTAWRPVRRQQMKRIEDVVSLLEEVTRKCAAGELPPRVASAVASSKTTFDVYGHLFHSTLQAVGAKLDQQVFGQTKQPYPDHTVRINAA